MSASARAKLMRSVTQHRTDATPRRHLWGMSVQEPSRLQTLYDIAKQTLGSGREPTPHGVQLLAKALREVPLEELGFDDRTIQAVRAVATNGIRPLKARLPSSFAHSRTGDTITYMHIHEDADLTMGIFCMPGNAQIPLHNHPGMTVFSRLLYGTMHIRSYDWQDEAAGPGHFRQARLVTDRVLTAPADPCVLFPNHGGNIHALTAVSPCAVLDILAPPYAPGEGRDCTYYLEHFIPQFVNADGVPSLASGEPLTGPQQQASVVELEEYDPPEDFSVQRGKYRGLPVRA